MPSSGSHLASSEHNRLKRCYISTDTNMASASANAITAIGKVTILGFDVR